MFRRTKHRTQAVPQAGRKTAQTRRAARLAPANWPLAAKMVTGFVLVLLAFAVASGLATWRLLGIERLTAGIEASATKLVLVQELSRVTLAKFSLVQDAVLEAASLDVNEFDRYAREFEEVLARLQAMELDKTEKETLNLVRQFDAGLNRTFKERLVPALQQKDDLAARITYRGELSGVQYQIVNLNESLRRRLEEKHREMVAGVHREVAAVLRSMYAGLGAAILAGILIAWLITRMITRPLKELQQYAGLVAQGDLTLAARVGGRDETGRLAQAFGQMVENLRSLLGQVQAAAQRISQAAGQVSASANEVGEAGRQVAVTVQEMARGMEEQSHQVNEAAQTIGGVAGEMEAVNGRVQAMAQSSTAVMDAVAQGRRAAAEAVAQMQAINERMLAVTRVVGQLGQRSQEIGRMVEMITAIAGQTNLLALNAAIEAARAGEQGRGFAVVAEEVRKLAEQSAAAAEQITELVGEIQAEAARAVEAITEGNREIGKGTAVIQRSDASFDHINQVTASLIDEIKEVAAAAARVAQAAQGAGQAVQNIASITEEVAAGTEEVSAQAQEQAAGVDEIVRALQELTRLAGELGEAVGRFRLKSLAESAPVG